MLLHSLCLFYLLHSHNTQHTFLQHARVTDSRHNDSHTTGENQESVDALTDFGVALSQMSSPVPPPSDKAAGPGLQAYHLVESWHKCTFLDDFQVSFFF